MFFRNICTLLLFSHVLSENSNSSRPKQKIESSNEHHSVNFKSSTLIPHSENIQYKIDKEIPSDSYRLYSAQKNSQKNRFFDSLTQQQQQYQQQQYPINYRPIQESTFSSKSFQNVPQRSQRIAHLYSENEMKSRNYLQEALPNPLSNTIHFSNSTPLISDSTYDSFFDGSNSDSGFDRKNSAFLDLFSPEKNIINEFGEEDKDKKNDFGDHEERKKNEFGDHEERKKNEFGDYEERKKNDYSGDFEDKKKNDYGIYDDKKKNNDYEFYEEKKKDDEYQEEQKGEEKKDVWGEEEKKKDDFGNDDMPFDDSTLQQSPHETYGFSEYNNNNPYQSQNQFSNYRSNNYELKKSSYQSAPAYQQKKILRNHDHSNQIPAAIHSEHNVQTYPVKNDRRPVSYNHAVVDIKSRSSLPLTLNFHTESTRIRAEQSHKSPNGSVKREILMEEPDVLIKIVKKPVIQQVREIIFPLRHRLQEVRPVYEHVETFVAKDKKQQNNELKAQNDIYDIRDQASSTQKIVSKTHV